MENFFLAYAPLQYAHSDLPFDWMFVGSDHTGKVLTFCELNQCGFEDFEMLKMFLNKEDICLIWTPRVLDVYGAEKFKEI